MCTDIVRPGGRGASSREGRREVIDWQTIATTILGWETGRGLWRFAAHNRQPRNAHEREHLQHERDVRNSGPYRGGYPGPWVDWGHAAECRICALPENRERKKIDYSWIPTTDGPCSAVSPPPPKRIIVEHRFEPGKE